MNNVMVCRFTKYDGNTDQKILCKPHATLETIAKLGCEPIMDSAIEVDISMIDVDGFYRPNPQS